MSLKKDKAGIAVLDIGTSKVVFAIADIVNDKLNIIPNKAELREGMKDGKIVNFPFVSKAIKEALRNLNLLYQKPYSKKVILGVTGCHLETYIAEGELALNGEEVKSQHRQDLMEDAWSKINNNQNYSRVHAFPQNFSIDSKNDISNPEGLFGNRLRSKFYFVMINRDIYIDFKNCIAEVGLELDRIVLQQYASALSVLKSKEQKTGVLLLDIGGGTTDYCIQRDNLFRYIGSIPLAGNAVSNDLMKKLNVSYDDAELIKKQLYNVLVKKDTTEIPEYLKKLDWSSAFRIVLTRYEEIFNYIRKEIAKNDCVENDFYYHIVITGGGSLIPGISKLAAEIFGEELNHSINVRIARPDNIVATLDQEMFEKVVALKENYINHPMYSTVVGLLICSYNMWKNNSNKNNTKKSFFDFFKKPFYKI